MFRLRRDVVVFAALCALLSVGSASAQTNTSAIAGVITDETGATVPNATVTVTETATGQVRTTTASGEYVVSQLAPGKYEVKVSAQGFQTAVASGVTLDVAQRARLDFTMKVGQLSQQVEVTARDAVLDTYTASLGQTIEQRTISN
jgi:hypothetical protein